MLPPSRVVELGGKLDTGSPCTDDRHLQLLWPKPSWLRVRAHQGVDQPTMKARRLACCLERNRVFLNARGSEIVGETVDCDHQCVVIEHALRRDLIAVLIEPAPPASGAFPC